MVMLVVTMEVVMMICDDSRKREEICSAYLITDYALL